MSSPFGESDLDLLPMGLDAVCLSEEAIAMASSAARAAKEVDEERAWTRFLRGLSITALKTELRRRSAAVVVGPELEPEAPGRLLALNGLTTQLVLASPLAESVWVPLAAWRRPEACPSLLLASVVDEDQGVVRIPGVLDAASFRDLLAGEGSRGQDEVEVPLGRFQGGCERILRWVELLEPEALGVDGVSSPNEILSKLEELLGRLLATLPPQPTLALSGVRSGREGTLNLITPRVVKDSNGALIATVASRTPTIWAIEPLAEIQLMRNREVVWKDMARRNAPLTGPQRWPLFPLTSEQTLVLRLRPMGAAGGSFVEVTLRLPPKDELETAEARIAPAVGLVDFQQQISGMNTELMLEQIARMTLEARDKL